MVSSAKSAFASVRSHSVTLLGGGFIALAAIYLSARRGSLSITIFEAMVPALVGVAMIGYGYWISRQGIDRRRPDIVAATGLACLAGFATVALVSIYFQQLRMGIDVDIFQATLLSASIGAGLGVILGHSYVSLSQQFRENVQLTRAIDSSMDGIAIVEGSRHVYANNAYASLYGIPGTDIIEGESWDALYTNESEAVVQQEVLPTVMERRYWRGRLTGVRTDGSTFPKEVTVTRVKNRFVVIVRDVSRQRDREQRIQVLNRVLRHNLRNTLTVIQGHVNLIADQAPEYEAAHVEPIRAEIADLITMADKARGVERTLERRGTYEMVEPSEAVRSVVDRATAANPDATILSRVEESGLPRIDASIVDALDELVDNAIEHAEHADPTVEISVHGVEYARGTRTEFTVVDDGPGIPESERRVVLDGEETPLEHGSGLGLWLVHWIVQNAGGQLRFGEAPGGGTVVTISILHDQSPEDRSSGRPSGNTLAQRIDIG